MNKYHNKKTVVDNIIFDSRKEAEFYGQLKMMLKGKAIKSFECHPKFILQGAFEKNGIKYPAIKYIADFIVYDNNGGIDVYDVKPYDKQTGKFLLTKEFRLKQKMFEKVFPQFSIILV